MSAAHGSSFTGPSPATPSRGGFYLVLVILDFSLWSEVLIVWENRYINLYIMATYFIPREQTPGFPELLVGDRNQHTIYPLTYEKITLLEKQLRHLRLQIEARYNVQAYVSELEAQSRSASAPGTEDTPPK